MWTPLFLSLCYCKTCNWNNSHTLGQETGRKTEGGKKVYAGSVWLLGRVDLNLNFLSNTYCSVLTKG